MKVTSNIEYIINYANDQIESEYCIHVLKEEANTSSLSSILESAIVSQASAPATIRVANPPTDSEEREICLLLWIVPYWKIQKQLHC